MFAAGGPSTEHSLNSLGAADAGRGLPNFSELFRHSERAVSTWEASELALLLLGNNNSHAQLNEVQSGKRSSTSAHHFAHQHLLSLFQRFADCQLLCVNGTARNHAVPEATKALLDQVAGLLVNDGVGLITGGATTGAMGAAIRSFTQNISACETEYGYCDAKIASVLLQLGGAHGKYEVPASLAGAGTASRRQYSWLNRTPALHGIGLQDVMAFLEGGFGTYFEIFLPFTHRQTADRGPIGIYDANRPASEFVFASSGYPLGGGALDTSRCFWSPIQEFILDMQKAGICKQSDAKFHAFPPRDIDFIGHAIPLLFRERREQRQQSSRRQFPNTFRDKARDVLIRLSSTELQARPCDHFGDENFLRFLDNVVANHRTIDHTRSVMALWGAGRYDEAEQRLVTACQGASSERASCTGTIHRLSERPAVYFIGTPKEVWNEQLELYSREVIDGAIKNGVTVVIDGKGTEGMARRWSELWAQGMAKHEKAHGSKSSSELVRVQLAYRGEEIPARTFEGGYTETVFPSLLNVETRTAVAASIGRPRAVVVAPGGHPEMLAFSQILLDDQLAGSVDGVYRSKAARPVINALNVEVIPGRLFFDKLKEQLAVMELGQTISPGEYRPSDFIDLEDPATEGRKLIHDLLQLRKN